MQINSLADLRAVIELCAKKGVTKFSANGISFELPEQERPKRMKKADTSTGPDTEQYTDEQILNWSAEPHIS